MSHEIKIQFVQGNPLMPIDEDSLMDAIADYLKPEKDILYQRSKPGERHRSISGIGSCDKAMWFLKIEIRQSERGNLLYVAASSYIVIPELQRANVHELLKRINSFYREDFEVDAGNPEFEIPEDIVTCIGWFELKEDALNDDNFALLLEKCITMAEEYFEAIMSVGFGGIDPSMAMEKLRKKQDTAKIMH